jgi:hypothetical protein
MKPSKLIKSKCKTQKEALEVCFSLIDYFCGTQEVEWAIECQKRRKDVPRRNIQLLEKEKR